MIAGLLKPTSGRVTIAGQDLAREPEAAKRALGFIPDRPVPLREADGRASSCASTAGSTASRGAALEARARELLELFELTDWADELVESFSHGMKQRLVMCSAFLHRPQAVLVDEPMVGLDPRGARLIKDVFRAMSQKGVAILMSTHTLEVAQEMCDRISIIQRRPDHRARHRRRAAGARRQRGPAAHAGVPEADRRRRLPGDRAVTAAFPFLLQPLFWSARNRARRRERGDGLRAALFGGIGAAGRGGALRDRLLAHLAARRLRGARRLPDPARARLAVPDLPLVRRLQRRW